MYAELPLSTLLLVSQWTLPFATQAIKLCLDIALSYRKMPVLQALLYQTSKCMFSKQKT